MDWVLDHLQLIIAIGGAIAWWLNQRAKEKRGESADYDGDGKPDVEPQAGRSMREESAAGEEEERARRIMEEIRRKRAERAAEEAQRESGGGTFAPPPLAEQEAPTPPPLWRREPEVSTAAELRRAEQEREAREVVERQQALAAQLAALQARRAEAAREAKEVWQQPEQRAAKSHARRGDELTLMQELRDARSLRKAIVLREVLGTPAGLR